MTTKQKLQNLYNLLLLTVFNNELTEVKLSTNLTLTKDGKIRYCREDDINNIENDSYIDSVIDNLMLQLISNETFQNSSNNISLSNVFNKITDKIINEYNYKYDEHDLLGIIIDVYSYILNNDSVLYKELLEYYTKKYDDISLLRIILNELYLNNIIGSNFNLTNNPDKITYPVKIYAKIKINMNVHNIKQKASYIDVNEFLKLYNNELKKVSNKTLYSIRHIPSLKKLQDALNELINYIYDADNGIYITNFKEIVSGIFSKYNMKTHERTHMTILRVLVRMGILHTSVKLDKKLSHMYKHIYVYPNKKGGRTNNDPK